MCITKTFDYSASILIDPCGEKRSYKLQALAWISTLALGVVTLGTAQLLSTMWRLNKNIKKNYTHDKISRLYHIATGQSDLDIAFSLTDQRFLDKLGTETQANLETVKDKITKQGSSIDRFVENEEALKELFKYEDYRHAFFLHADNTNNEELLKYHKEIVVNKMIRICGSCFKDNLHCTKGFIKSFEEKIASEFLGKVAINDFLSEEVINKFCEDHYTREYLFEKFINLKKYVNKNNNQDSSNQASLNNAYVANAKALGKQHKDNNTNIFEILDLKKNLPTKDLIKQCKIIMIKNHPDRNPEGEEKFKVAGNLKEILDNKTLEVYEQALKN